MTLAAAIAKKCCLSVPQAQELHFGERNLQQKKEKFFVKNLDFPGIASGNGQVRIVASNIKLQL